MSETEMGKGGKIAVTVMLVLGFVVISAVVLGSGGSQAFVALIALGLFYGIRSMFKSGPEDDSVALELNKDKPKAEDHQL